MGATEPTITEDPAIIMEDISRVLHLEGQQKASTEAIEGEKVRQETAMVKEVITDRGQEGDAQVEDSLPEEHPNTIVATGLSLF